jgi:hypothetical protein
VSIDQLFEPQLTLYKVMAVLLMGVCLVAVLWVGARSNLLRDTSRARNPPFSFSRVQLIWWSVIIGLACLMYYGASGDLPDMTRNWTCLILLGLGVGTTATASIIDDRQRTVAVDRDDAAGVPLVHQDSESAGFFVDILSDEKGLSVHRFQALLFNFIYGTAFLTAFIRAGGVFPNYGVEQFALLGISSAGYLGMKAMENGSPLSVAQAAASSTPGAVRP